jgi:hypothetical protein
MYRPSYYLRQIDQNFGYSAVSLFLQRHLTRFAPARRRAYVPAVAGKLLTVLPSPPRTEFRRKKTDVISRSKREDGRNLTVSREAPFRLLPGLADRQARQGRRAARGAASEVIAPLSRARSRARHRQEIRLTHVAKTARTGRRRARSSRDPSASAAAAADP